MNVKYLLLIYFFFFSEILLAQVVVTNLLCENLTNPLGIDKAKPRFSWQLVSDKRNIMQSAYEIKVAKSLEALEKDSDLIWHSGKIISDQSVHLKYEGAPLLSGEKHFWQVRVWDDSEKPSRWSAPAYFQTGLLSSNDWEAKWIQSTLIEDTINGPVTLFRKEFLSPKNI